MSCHSILLCIYYFHIINHINSSCYYFNCLATCMYVVDIYYTSNWQKWFSRLKLFRWFHALCNTGKSWVNAEMTCWDKLGAYNSRCTCISTAFCHFRIIWICLWKKETRNCFGFPVLLYICRGFFHLGYSIYLLYSAVLSASVLHRCFIIFYFSLLGKQTDILLHDNKLHLNNT